MTTDEGPAAAALRCPPALAALREPLAAIAGDAAAFERDWQAALERDADLDKVPVRLVLWMLSNPEAPVGDDPAGRALMRLHERERDGQLVQRSDWTTTRRAILALGEGEAASRRGRQLALWEAAAWPAGQGRSILVETMRAWRDLAEFVADSDWSDRDSERKTAILDAIWREQADARSRDEAVDYHALFVARDADLAGRFLLNLRLVNAHVAYRSTALVQTCLALMRGRRDDPA